MFDYPKRIEIQNRIREKFSHIFANNGEDHNHLDRLGLKQKEDFSPLTEIDEYISDLIKDEVQKISGQKFHFLSEEEINDIHFPLAILDPIDGTRELVKGIGQCSMSLAFMLDKNFYNPKNSGWIYNPFTGFDIHSLIPFCPAPNLNSNRLNGLVSNSEWNKGLKDIELEKNISISPVGSIAFKLGLLAVGSCDFIYSHRPKNIWDIAAGTILCAARGIKLYDSQGLVETFEGLKINGPLLWCFPDHYNELKQVFSFINKK